ncbi:MAG: lytic transglycosylase domain-containing protein, partial [Alphaproteobacteria bacterium]
MKNKGYFWGLIAACGMSIGCVAHSRETAFETWKHQLAAQAVSAGVNQDFMEKLLPHIQLLPEVVEADRKQPEFQLTFWDYTDRALSPKRIETGRKMMTEHADLLARVEEKYGVPAKYIVAFWGLETAYGTYQGNIDTLNALATMAFDERRRSFFTKELITFLKILQQEKLPRVKGSWAGAFGNFQFMPSTFAAYAVDGDCDGRRDIVNSLPDAIESAAHYLSEMGWNKNVKWGREVILPLPPDWMKIY